MDAFESNINSVPRHQLKLCLSTQEGGKHSVIVARRVMVYYAYISLAGQWRALLYRSKIEHSPGDSHMSQKRESCGVVVILLIGYQYERALFFSSYCYCPAEPHIGPEYFTSRGGLPKRCYAEGINAGFPLIWALQ